MVQIVGALWSLIKRNKRAVIAGATIIKSQAIKNVLIVAGQQPRAETVPGLHMCEERKERSLS